VISASSIAGCSERPSDRSAFSDLQKIAGCYSHEGFESLEVRGSEIFYGHTKTFDIVDYGYLGRSRKKLIYVKPRLFMQKLATGDYGFASLEWLPKGYNSALLGEMSEEDEGVALNVNLARPDASVIRFDRTSDDLCRTSRNRPSTPQ
jgi:hypothetical protein